MSGAVFFDGHLFGFDESILKCITLDGEERWRKRGLGTGSMTVAGGRLVILDGKGQLVSTFDIDAGAVNGGRIYAQLYSLSGLTPGYQGPATWTHVPLNIDSVTTTALNAAGSAQMPDAIGLLSPGGQASTTLTLPANVTLILSGLELYSTVITYFQGNVSATNPVVVPIP